MSSYLERCREERNREWIASNRYERTSSRWKKTEKGGKLYTLIGYEHGNFSAPEPGNLERIEQATKDLAKETGEETARRLVYFWHKECRGIMEDAWDI